MNYREIEVLGPTDLGASGTKIIDLDIADVITDLQLIWRTKVHTVSVMLAEHVACLSKIEIVDGSDVLFSLSGKQAQALAFYTTGRMPFNELSLTANDYMTSVIPINFGRYQGDTEYAFDPKKYTNPQLKITFDEDAANTSVDTNELTVRANAFDEKSVSPIGLFMCKEIKSYTPVASAYEYTDLPTDYPYRAMLMRSYSTTIDPFAAIGEFKLSEEHDKRIPYDLTGPEIFRKIIEPSGVITELLTLDDAVTAKTLYLASSYGQKINIQYDETAFVTTTTKFALPTVTSNEIALAASAEIKAQNAVVQGYAPYSCFLIPFGNLNDAADWYDVTRLGNLRLTTKGAAAVGTSPNMEVVLQQVRT